MAEVAAGSAPFTFNQLAPLSVERNTPDSVPQNNAVALRPIERTFTLAPLIGSPVLARVHVAPSLALFRTPAGGAATKMDPPKVVTLRFPVPPTFSGSHCACNAVDTSSVSAAKSVRFERMFMEV